MSLSVTASTGSTVNIQDLIAEAEKVSSENRKNAKLQRQLHHQKNMVNLDQSIGAMKDQQKQLGKAGWFSFIVGMVSNFLNMATLAISTFIPALAPVAMAVNKGLQAFLGAFPNPYTKKAGKAAIKVDEFKKLAENEQFRSGMEDERIKAMTESDGIFKGRMEKAVENMQKAQESAVRA